jgi:hypothetical protein
MEQNEKSNEAGGSELKSSLKAVLAEVDLHSYQETVKQLSEELQISVLDCAAALFKLYQSGCLDVRRESEVSSADKKTAELDGLQIPQISQKSVRYRIEIGQIHKVEEEVIRNVLVDVSGVDCNRIGRLEIRNHYTLVDLPEGMPADIFQLLSEVEINQQKLCLKRIKFQRRTQRRRRKRYPS